MRQNELTEAFDQISRGRRIDKKVLIDAVEGALVVASQKYFGLHQRVAIHFDEESGKILATVSKRVVQETQNVKAEISLENALKIKHFLSSLVL